MLTNKEMYEEIRQLCIMRKVYAVLGVVMVLLLTSCSSPIVGSVLDDRINTFAEDGTDFIVRRIENNVPDQEISIFVAIKDKEIFYCANIASHLQKYDYSNDIVEKYAEIINEYHSGEVDAYQFHWGIIYTSDNGNSYQGVPKHLYEEQCETNEEFQKIYEQL